MGFKAGLKNEVGIFIQQLEIMNKITTLEFQNARNIQGRPTSEIFSNLRNFQVDTIF